MIMISVQYLQVARMKQLADNIDFEFRKFTPEKSRAWRDAALIGAHRQSLYDQLVTASAVGGFNVGPYSLILTI